MKNHLWKATKSSIAFCHIHSELAQSLYSLQPLYSTLHCALFSPAAASISVLSWLFLCMCHLLQNIWISANGDCKNVWMWRAAEHQELCILSLRHGQFTVSSALLLTRCVNLQAIDKTPKKEDIHMNKMGSCNFCYYDKKLPFDDVVISKGQTNSMTEQREK